MPRCCTPLDLQNAKVLNATTLQLPCKTPFSTFVDSLVNPFCLMVPEGYDPKSPDGTGPFKYKSFTPGVRSEFPRNPNYFENGKPYADDLIITDIPDETSQVNALLGGQVNLINFLSSDSLAALQTGSVNVVISKTGGWNPITMRVDTAPFSDVRVRQAMKLIVDRPQMLDLVFGGHGRIGNDVFGYYDPLYDHSLPQRHQDIDQAKSLLKAAGHENLTVTLTTSAGIGQGIVKTAQVFAQQAKAAGVTVNVNAVTASTWFGQDYLKVPFGQDYWFYLPYLVNVPQVTIPGRRVQHAALQQPDLHQAVQAGPRDHGRGDQDRPGAPDAEDRLQRRRADHPVLPAGHRRHGQERARRDPVTELPDQQLRLGLDLDGLAMVRRTASGGPSARASKPEKEAAWLR